MKVYIVTSGSYSDYGIDAVFSTRDLAKKYISSLNSSRFHEFVIETWDLDSHKEELRKGFKLFFVRMDKQGNTQEIEHSDHEGNYEDPAFDVDSNLISFVLAKDETHAIKIVNERRIRLIAENSWEKK